MVIDMADPLLSIIMPCYNGEETIIRAINSIYNQKMDYSFEIIVIDDGSTDNSVDVIDELLKAHSEIVLYRNEKNLGNAITFYNGLKYAQGKYFCVLDVDDYYSVNDKLKKQIDFLESDVDENFVAVTHHYVIDLMDDKVHIPDMSNVTEFNYVDIINQRCGYYHTSTYVYRHIFKNHVPDFFKEGRFRGDTIRTIFLLMYSNKKVKVLNFVGSVYTWSMNGIWSSITQKKQFDIQIGIWSGLKEFSSTEMEKNAFEHLIQQCISKRNKVDDIRRQYPEIIIEDALRLMCQYGGKYAFENREFTFKGLYYSEYLDSLASTLGHIYINYHPEFKHKKINEKSIVIVVSHLKPNGGGIFREITEFVKMHGNYDVHIISTERGNSDDGFKSALEGYKNLTVHLASKDYTHKLNEIMQIYSNISPGRTYYYDSHDDYYPFALMPAGIGKNILLFSFDHGFVSGISSPDIETIIAKRPLDYQMLKRQFGDKVIYIPAWNDDCGKDVESFQYVPFKNHDKLITACGSARYYKLVSNSNPSYVELVLHLLKNTGGQHIHFGPIPDDVLKTIQKYIKANGMRRDAFVYVEWSEDPLKLMMDSNVDLFIEPFPIVSYKITMDALMCGIPIISREGYTRMSTVDFIYKNSMKWKTENDFMKIIEKIDAEQLKDHSIKSKEYFKNNHSTSVIYKYYLSIEGKKCEFDWVALDNYVHDVLYYEKSYANGHIRLATAISNNLNINSILPNKVGISENTLISKICCAARIFLSKVKNMKRGEEKMGKVNVNEIKMLYESKNKKDNIHAFQICKKNISDPYAKLWLSRMYRNGIGIDKDISKALENIELAVLGGLKNSRNEYVDILLETGIEVNAEKALLIAKEFAEEGNGAASGRIAKMYRDGIGVEKNSELFEYWVKIAAERGIDWAKKSYIQISMQNNKQSDFSVVFDYAMGYAKDGDLSSCGYVGRMYRDGKGVEADSAEALKWLKLAGDGNIIWAKREYADILASSGVNDDKIVAFNIIKDLAEKGDSPSCGRLGIYYRDGIGIKKDVIEAKKWLKIAADANISWAVRDYNNMVNSTNDK